MQIVQLIRIQVNDNGRSAWSAIRQFDSLIHNNCSENVVGAAIEAVNDSSRYFVVRVVDDSGTFTLVIVLLSFNVDCYCCWGC